MAGYHRAVEKCKAKVDRISKECRLSNQKYNDPSFNLWDYSYCLRPLSTNLSREKSKTDSEEPLDTRPSPPKMTLYVNDANPVNLTKFLSSADDDDYDDRHEDYVEESPGAVPQSVKRVRQIFDHPEFFVDGATADDVRQGVAGDCWFLSALSALCCMEPKELGNLVERICVHRDEAVGIYGFVFFRDGEWRSEIIDDKLYLTAPDYNDMDNSADMSYLLKYMKKRDRAEQYRKIVQSNSKALFFARSAHKNETWVPLIEKAFAKAHGDFDAIDGGYVADGIEDLTGGLATFLVSEDIVDLDKFWDEGLALVNKTFLWGCSTTKVNREDGQGIASSHAYSVLEARTIPDGTRLLKVRNPWGSTEWEGDWSDRSKKWTDELKKLLKHEDKDDGIFWISYEDLLRTYPYLHRTRIFNASWTVAQMWSNFTVPILSSDTYEKAFKLTLSNAATTTIVLSQLDGRYFQGLEGQYEYALSFRLHKWDDDDYLYRCHHRHFTDRSINLEVELEAGVYEVRLKIKSDMYTDRPKLEDVVRINWKNSRTKLLQTCRSYDLAHAKVAAPEQNIENSEARKTSAEPTSAAKLESQKSTDKSEDFNRSSAKSQEPGSKSMVSGSQTIADGRPEAGTKEVTIDSPVEVSHDHKSDTDTNSTEPELIEKADLNLGSENDGIDVEKKDARSTKSRTSDQAAQTNTVQGAAEPTSRQKEEPEEDDHNAEDDHNTDNDHDTDDDHDTEDDHDTDDDHTTEGEEKKDKDKDPERPSENDIGSEEGEHRAREDKDSSTTPEEPFTSVCTVGLRVYCKDAEATIELIRPSTAAMPEKQFTSSDEAVLDVDDPAKS